MSSIVRRFVPIIAFIATVSTPAPASPLQYQMEGPPVGVAGVMGDVAASTAAQRLLAAADSREGGVMGTVIDAQTGQPLAGVQLFLPQLGVGMITNARGAFSLSDLPAGTHVIEIRFLGYASEERTISVSAGETVTLEVSLRRQVLDLDAVVVTGTAGGARQREVGTAVSRVDASQLQMAAAPRLAQALQGQVSGLTMTQGGAQAGAAPRIALRGSNSVSQGDHPLIYIDGVRIYSDLASTGLSGAGSNRYNPISNLNVADIERIEVVRGPAATTLYGTEASTGVIQIFTRRGSAGQSAQWSAAVTAGVNTLRHPGPKKDNPEGFGFMQCRDRPMSTGERFSDITCPESGSFAKTALLQRYNVGVRGGVSGFTYAVSGHLGDEGAPIDGSAVGLDRVGYGRDGGFRANFTLDLSPTLSAEWTSSASFSNPRWIAEGTSGAAEWGANMSRGLFGAVRVGGELASAYALLVDAYDKRRQVTTGLTMQHRPFSRFNHRLSVGVDLNQNNASIWFPVGHWNFTSGRFDDRHWSATTVTLDYGANVRTEFWDGAVSSTTSAGFQANQEDERNLLMRTEDYPGPMAVPTLTAGAIRSIPGDSRLRVINAGFYAQQVLGYNDHLFLTGGVRVDGNSAFGSGFGLQAYPKLSVSYVISDMDFWPSHWFESMQLRAAVGEAGKAPGAFSSVRSWSAVVAGDGSAGFRPAALGDSLLGPERSREFEAGFDASLYGGRVTAEATVFRQRTYDALIPVQAPPSMGFLSTQLRNIGTLQNQGAEFSLGLDVVRQAQFNWDLDLMASLLKSEAIDLGGQNISLGTFFGAREGYPVPAYFATTVRNPKEIADPEIENDAFIGPAYPTHTFGVRSSVTIRNQLTISAFGEYQGGAYTYNATSQRLAMRDVFGPCFETQAAHRASLGGDPSAWSQVPAYMRFKCSVVGSEQALNRWVERTDYFRLRSLSLDYRLPAGWVPGAGAATLGLSATNLLTLTDYWGTDPEGNYGGRWPRTDYHGLPPYKTFTASLSVTF